MGTAGCVRALALSLLPLLLAQADLFQAPRQPAHIEHAADAPRPPRRPSRPQVRPSTTPLRWTCRRALLRASRALTPPDLPFSDAVLLSPTARRALARAQEDDARRGVVARWFARQARRRSAGSRECEVEVGAGMPLAGPGAGAGDAGEAGGAEGGPLGAAGWRFVRLVVPATQRQRDEGGTGQGEAREVLDVGWAVAEMWLAAARARVS